MLYYQAENSTGNYHYDPVWYEDIYFHYHFHQNLELVYVQEGAVEVLLEHRTETLTRGLCALIMPNQIHSYRSPGHSRCWVGVFSQDYVADFSGKTRGLEGARAGFPCPDFLFPLLKRALLAPEPAAEEFSTLCLRKACLYAMCSQYLSCQGQKLLPAPKEKKLSHQILEIVSENFTSNLTLAEVARRLGYDYHYLSRFFHAIFGSNFRTFLGRYRYDRAVYLLSHTGLSITEVALKSVFQSIRSFNRLFREFSGISPQEYVGRLP